MRRLPPLAALRVFEAAGRHENFTLAANELGMTQAAVSYQVKTLEERVGAPLFVRARGRVHLTALGRRLLPSLTRAFDSIESAFAVTRAEDDALLTVTTTPTLANTWLAWRIGGFQVAHPDLGVRIVTGNAVADLPAGEADVAIRSGEGEWDGLAAHFVMDIEFTPMATPGLLRRMEAERGRPIEPADLIDAPLISPDDEWWTQWFSEVGISYDIGLPRGGIRLDFQADVGQAAMAGQGFGLLTPRLWRNDMAEGRLAQPFERVSRWDVSYWLAYPEERRSVPKIKRFREWLLAEAAKG